MIHEGDSAPDFTLPLNGGKQISLKDFAGKITVLFFYPKDDTSGCTKEAIAFTEHSSSFNDINAQVIGVSPDSVESHNKFVEKHNLAVPLIADEEKELIRAFGAWVEKNMYGRKYMGVDRSTFLIDKDGKIAKIWRKVKVPGHAEKVLEAAQELAGQ